MGTYEGYREGTPNPLVVSYPEAEMRQGDFSKLTNSVGQKVTIYNPFDSTLDSTGNAIRSPFPGNVIPKNLLNPIALEAGARFAIREGGRTVGAGVVLEVLK